MNKLLILDDEASIYREEIEKHPLPDLEIITADNVDQSGDHVSQVDIIFGRPALVSSVINKATRLQWVQSTYAGVEQLCQPNLPRDYLLTGIKDLFGSFMREYVFAYILANERSMVTTFRNQRGKVWHRIPYRSLSGITIGIVGLGSIGREIARTAHHFDMRVLGMKRTHSPVDHVDRLFLPSELSEFLPQLDYLVLVLPDTSQSRQFITSKELKLMKSDAIVINVGRGNSINQRDLITALQSNQIGGAVLDVFEQEPLPQDNPLWSMENVAVTPHNSAYSFPEQVAEIFCDNYLRFLQKTPLLHVVDFNRGY